MARRPNRRSTKLRDPYKAPTLELAGRIAEMRDTLWLDEDERGFFYNPEKEWNTETVELLADALEDFRPVRKQRVKA